MTTPHMNKAARLPVCVDLDGTLIRSDLLYESLWAALRRNPLLSILVPLWLLRGRAILKQELALRGGPDVATLPYRETVLEHIQALREEGHKLLLVTASTTRLANRIAEHLGLFDDVLASDDQTNLKGANKQTVLVERFGERGYIYIGDSRADLPVWSSASEAILVAPSQRLVQQASNSTKVRTIIDSPPNTVYQLLKAIRPHQWLKNLLMIVPFLTAHLFNLADFATLLLAMFSFSLCASSVYLLNDMLDLESDRHHPRKRKRPFASGELSLVVGMLATPTLLLVAFSIAVLMLPQEFVQILAGYYALTLLYSSWLKRKEMLDALLLASLYTMRIVAGAAALSVEVSSWLLALSMFLFFSLALVKRYTELRTQLLRGESVAHGRGYQIGDLETIAQLGISSGNLTVLVMALYLNSDTVKQLYSQPQLLWLMCPLLLYLIGRIWLLTRRGRLHDDPVVFVATDANSLLVGALGATLFYLAL